jgi:hypothetical protein
MKKLFSVASIFLIALTLVGCSEPVDSTEQIDLLELQLAEKETMVLQLQNDLNELQTSLNETLELLDLSDTQKDNLQSLVTILNTEIFTLESEIAELQELIFDNVITFTFNDGSGLYLSDTVGYNDDFDGTLFDLLNENFDVTYLDSEYGVYITGVEGISTMQGNYIAFYKNDEMSMVGVDSASFADGDVFGFELTWWDTGLEALNNGIELFIEEQSANYVNSMSVDLNVLLALEILGIREEYITNQELIDFVDTTNLTTNNDYFKAMMKLQVAGEDVTDLATSLASNANIAAYGGTAYGLLALNSFTNTIDYTSFETAAFNSFNVESPYDMELDSGGITLVALSAYSGNAEADAMIAEFAQWISDDQLNSGGIETRDMGWGSSENAASMSQVILALVANDIDPRGVDYTKDTNNLITRLLEFQTSTGSFDWVLTDESTEDLLFSTPQAFLALVVYQEYINTGQAVNPYTFQ